MKTMTLNQNLNRRLPWLAAITLSAAAMFAVTACSTTRQARSVSESGFLGDYSQLKKGTGDQAKLVYFNPTADWSLYNKIYIEPVELWKSDDKDTPLGKLSPDDQQMLVNLLYTDLNNELQKSYTIVDQPGPNTIIVRVAITQASKSAPVRNLATAIVPFGIAANILKTAVFGTGIGVGQVQIEGELLDGQTHERLAAAVDRRCGTKALRTKFDGTWGDVNLAFQFWSERLETRLVDLRAGKAETGEM